MKKKALRWIIIICAALLALIVIGVLSFDSIAKSVAERRIRQETGMDAHIGKLNISFRNHTVHIEGLRLVNPPEFGGDTFVRIPELHLEADLEAFRQNQLHLKLVRFDIAEVHVVENKEGKKNIDLLQKHGETGKAPGEKSEQHGQEPMRFAGIDRLELSLGVAKFTSERKPSLNFERNLRIENRVFENIDSEKELQSIGVVLAAQAGFNALLEGVLTSPGEVIKKGSSAGKETKKLLENLVAPLKKKE